MNNILYQMGINFNDLPQVTKNFDLREFVSKEVYAKYGNKSIWFVNPVLFNLMQFHKEMLVEEYKTNVSIVINNWHIGGNRGYSGHRPMSYINAIINAGGKAATLSQHIGGMCNATDSLAYIDGKPINPSEIRKFILENEDEYMEQGLTTLEGDRWAKTWCHMDCRPTGLENILIVGA